MVSSFVSTCTLFAWMLLYVSAFQPKHAFTSQMPYSSLETIMPKSRHATSAFFPMGYCEESGSILSTSTSLKGKKQNDDDTVAKKEPKAFTIGMFLNPLTNPYILAPYGIILINILAATKDQ